METREFLLHARLDPQELEAWLEAGWLSPGRAKDALLFSDIDSARAQLIRDLKTDMGVNDEGIAIILDLLDQIYGLRGRLRNVVSAISVQHDMVRRQIIADIRASSSRIPDELRQQDTTARDHPP
jgi:chaperone modulatory protein CbpM